MKKLFAALLALAMLLSAAALAEGAEAAEVVENAGEIEAVDPEAEARALATGLWYLNEISMEGVAVSPATLGLETTIELREDGVAVATGNDAEADARGSWELAIDGIIVTLGEEPMSMALQDESLVTESDGVRMVFGRSKAEAEAFEPAAPVKAGARDYEGDWAAFKLEMDGLYLDAALLGGDITAVIEGTTLTLNGFVFIDEVVELAYEDGALIFASTDPEVELFAGVTAQLLEDDTLSLTLSAGEEGAFAIIMKRAENDENESAG